MNRGLGRCAWAIHVLLAGALFAGCAGSPVQRPEPEPAEVESAAPLGEALRPRTHDEALMEARQALARKDYQAAASAAHEATRLAPDPAAARLVEAEARQAMGDAAGALPLWQAAVAAGPDQPRVWAAYAELAVARGRGAEALERFQERLGRLPSGENPDPTLAGIAGWTALAAGHGDRAASYLETTVGTGAEGAFAVALGRARLAVGDLTGAEAVARRAAAGGEPAAAEGTLLLGDVLREQGRAAGAREAYEKVLEVVPDHYAARVNLGVLTLQQGDAEAALELFQTAAADAPGFPEAWHNLGLAQRSLAHWEESKKAYETALQVDPRYTPSLKNLGVLIEKYLGRPGEALTYYDRYVEAVPGDEEVRRWRKNAERLAAQEAN